MNDPSLSNMKRTVSERYKQQMAGMGLDVPDLTTDEDNALPPIGARSVANNRRASNPIEGARSAPPPKSNPIIESRQPKKSLDDLAKEHGL